MYMSSCSACVTLRHGTALMAGACTTCWAHPWELCGQQGQQGKHLQHWPYIGRSNADCCQAYRPPHCYA